MVSRPVFEEHFWHCYDQLKQRATPEVGVPGYFRFVTLLGGSLITCD
jgi:folylpolyglutamate synthase